MSLIGIDLGTSVDQGRRLRRRRDGRSPPPVETCRATDPSPATGRSTSASRGRPSGRPSPPSRRDPAVRADPPVAISFSSSGREVFPVAADGTPLGPCLMTADIARRRRRRGDRDPPLARGVVPSDRARAPAHGPRQPGSLVAPRRDPDVTARTRWFMNWHEYYALLLSGRPVVDWSDAGTWATYDVATGGWSAERIAETGIDPAWLPEVQPNATPIGPILPGRRGRVRPPADDPRRHRRLRHLRRRRSAPRPSTPASSRWPAGHGTRSTRR